MQRANAVERILAVLGLPPLREVHLVAAAMKRRRPTRRDLLLVIGELQNVIGKISEGANDRNPSRAEDIADTVARGMRLCIEARSFDPPISGGSRGGWP